MDSKVCTKCGVEKPLSEMVYNKTNDYYSTECKACQKAYMQEYRRKNRDKLIAFDRARYAANPEFKRRLAREWAKKNRERHSENTNRWYHNNHAKARAINAKWEQSNRDKVRAIKSRRRARIAGTGGSFTAEQWRRLKEVCDFKCLCCERQEPEIVLTLDHVVPVAVGGRNDISNLQPLCQICNSRKGVKTVDYRNAEIKAACQLLSGIKDTGREDAGEACYVEATAAPSETIRAC